MRKKTHSEIQALFEADGYQLLSSYQGASEKMQAACPVGHKVLMTWHGFKQGKRCSECSKVARADKRRTPQAVVWEAFASAGYQVLAERYETNLTRMDGICPEGHRIKMDWASFQAGVRCRECGDIKKGLSKRRNTAAKAIASFAAEGYQLLDDYTDSHTPMQFICPQGHQHQMSWTNFDSGYRCAYCAGQVVTPERVQQSFEAEGYQLLDEYSGKKRRLRFICSSGHKYSISWDNWNAGTRCAMCAGRIVTPRQVKEAFNVEGYILLTPYRWNNTQKLESVCSAGHEYSTTWAYWKAGNRCIYCSNRAPVNPEMVEGFFAAAGYTSLTRYQGTDTKILYVCPNGHRHSITWNSFKNGCRCPECKGKIVRHEDVELGFAAEGCELLDRYKNAYTPLRYVCPEGHQHQCTWNWFKKGTKCPYCSGQRLTKEQQEINSIKKNVAALIRTYLQLAQVQRTFSATGFAKSIALEIHQVLGARPEDHHLDHIIPQSFFDFRSQKEIEAVWSIENLRYILASENCSRGDRLTISEVSQFSVAQLKLLAKASRRPRTFDAILKSRGII